MKRNLLTLVSSLTLLLCATSSLFAQDKNPPEKMTFQGFLTDEDGAPIGQNAPVNESLIFKIYDAPSIGNLIWGETQTVTIDKGHFSVLLGNGSAVANTYVDHDKLYQVFATLGGSEILPRIQFFAAPYAQLARVANELASDTNGTISTGSITTDVGGVKSVGDIQSDGNVVAQGNITGKDITGTKLNLTGVDNTITAGAITGTSLSLGSGNIDAGAISSTSLSAGSGPVTGNTLTLTGKFSGKNIEGTSLSLGSGTITAGKISGKNIEGTSLSLGSGTITAGKITPSSIGFPEGPDITGFPGLSATNGHQEIGDILIQWGRATSTSDGGQTFDFPKPFSAKAYSLVLNRLAKDPKSVLSPNTWTATGFQIDRNSVFDGSHNFSWIAIGPK
jgi:hypothetical protein